MPTADHQQPANTNISQCNLMNSSHIYMVMALRRLKLFKRPYIGQYWRRKWQPTPVFLPGESQGRGSLVGCRLWGRTESDTTEAT